MGGGSNRVTGGEGVDAFVGDINSSAIDTLIESFGGENGSTLCSAITVLVITYEQLTASSNPDGSVTTTRAMVTDVEDDTSGINLFENFFLYGGAGNDAFSMNNFTRGNAVLDGTEGVTPIRSR